MFPHEHGPNDIRLLWCLSLAFVHYIEQLLLYLSSYAISITGEIYLEVKKTFSYREFQSSVLYLNVPISWTQNRSQTYLFASVAYHRLVSLRDQHMILHILTHQPILNFWGERKIPLLSSSALLVTDGETPKFPV